MHIPFPNFGVSFSVLPRLEFWPFCWLGILLYRPPFYISQTLALSWYHVLLSKPLNQWYKFCLLLFQVHHHYSLLSWFCHNSRLVHLLLILQSTHKNSYITYPLINAPQSTSYIFSHQQIYFIFDLTKSRG